ncbi:FemAB family protein [Aquimarina sp. ERC-38]|uniref:FemAB family protein n=1 Tax=Aquimarina sp. ERC-38 TaxID=2949996 RepID=UPI002244FF0B|nr:FemAB family protein [Aquimarina sp. ERC-38]UZO80830.1 FemAB family protein [Aquimarina sp. ERC-38]
MYSVKKYTSSDRSDWNNFVSQSKNGTFLFYREFMEYHSDRFVDFSLLVYEKNKLVALFPANVVGHTVYSHQGLTYGGLVLKNNIGGKKVDQIINALLHYFKKQQITKLLVKPIPRFYHQFPSNEMEFFLYEKGSLPVRRDLNLAIDYKVPLQFHKSKHKKFRKAKDFNLQIRKVDELNDFWEEILIPRLKEKHKVKPVHTLPEITNLKSNFPNNILQYNVYLDNNILAGITIFKDKNVVKSQYGATSEVGEQKYALDYLFMSLIDDFKRENYLYFDMGSVTDQNFGLLKQKEELGCNIYYQDYLELLL